MFPAPPWTIMQGFNGLLVSAMVIIKKFLILKPNPEPRWYVRSWRPRDMTRRLTSRTTSFQSNMADDLVQAGEQEIQEYFDAAVNVAKQAGQVIK